MQHPELLTWVSTLKSSSSLREASAHYVDTTPCLAHSSPFCAANMAHTLGLAKNAAGQARSSASLTLEWNGTLGNPSTYTLPFPHKKPGQVEGFEIFIKFLPPSASAASLKEFFGEVRESPET